MHEAEDNSRGETCDPEVVTVDRIVLQVGSSLDLLRVLREVASCAGRIGFSPMKIALITAAVTELVNNVLRYAGRGSVLVRDIRSGRRRGIHITVSDRGPGIADVERALMEGFSTSRGLGLGLSACRRMMDDFDLTSRIGEGTIVKTTKWL